MRWIAGIVALLAVPGAAWSQSRGPESFGPESFGNAEVIALHRAGLEGEAIVAKIRGLPCGYDTSTKALIALRAAAVPQAVILAMITRCNGGAASESDAAMGHAAGIFLERGGPGGEVLLRPSAATSLKVVGPPPGLGGILFATKAWLIVQQASAQASYRGGRPVFLFQFNPARKQGSDFGEPGSDSAQSPTEFSLVRFRIDNGSRQATIGRVQANIEISGIDPKNTLPFTVEERGNGLFRVTMPQDLMPGQYGFVLVGERERRKGTLFRVYDFAVTGAP